MTLDLVRDIIAGGLFGLGGFFVVLGAIGLLRFPDFYTRVHAAGVTDTLGAELILLGMAVQSDSWWLVAKLALIALFLLFTGPVGTHALTHAAWVGGLNPLCGRELKHEDLAPDEDRPEGGI